MALEDGPWRDEMEKQVERAVGILESGGVVAVPTDTLYGLVASASNADAVARVFRIKRRAPSEPLPLLLAETADMDRYGVALSDVAWTLAESFFPGPLTLVVRSAGNLPDVVTAGRDTVAVRVPDHWVPRETAGRLGAAITGTSANRAGMPGAPTAAEVVEQLGDEVDLVVDGGRCPGGVASTVLDVSGATPRIIREGAVSRAEIERACGIEVEAPARTRRKDARLEQ